MPQKNKKIFDLALNLEKCGTFRCKRAYLRDLEQVKSALKDSTLFSHYRSIEADDVEGICREVAFFSILAIGQEDLVFSTFHEMSRNALKKAFLELLDNLTLLEVEYKSIGGIIGYHAKVLELVEKKKRYPPQKVTYSQAQGINLAYPSLIKQKALEAGILAIPEIGELYPVGGLGDRLGLKDRFGIPLPAAALPFNRKDLLTVLIEDLIGREFLYYKLFGKQVITPVALMTSLEKHNHAHIKALLQKHHFFGRGEKNFFLFPQDLVPVLTEEGDWVMSKPFKLQRQPGGHGLIWKTALRKGVFEWFLRQGKTKGLIRQINNPIAGVDDGLITFFGFGALNKKAFGFASCDRLVNAHEGMLVLAQKPQGFTLSNIEYTDFFAAGIEDRPATQGSIFSCFPANTNIIYADLKQTLPVIEKHPLPGLMINMKSQEEKKQVACGRLESMMQGLADFFVAQKETSLPTYLTYNAREKTISAAKKKYIAGESLLETPLGAFYDLLRNGHTLLSEKCGMKCPPFSSIQEYLAHGPSLFFTYHPALGPLWEVIKQKIVGGESAKNSELQLDIAEVFISNLSLEGSLLITAKNVVGVANPLTFSEHCGKCELIDVTVSNQGMKRKNPQNLWQHPIERHESCTIILEGNAELYAESVVFAGDQTIHIPNNERWVATKGQDVDIEWIKEPINDPSWSWKYSFTQEGDISLSRIKHFVERSVCRTLS